MTLSGLFMVFLDIVIVQLAPKQCVMSVTLWTINNAIEYCDNLKQWYHKTYHQVHYITFILPVSGSIFLDDIYYNKNVLYIL